MSDKANDELRAAAELVLVRQIKATHEEKASDFYLIRGVVHRLKTNDKYTPYRDNVYIFGPDSAIVAGVKGVIDSYARDKFGFVDGVPYLRVGSVDSELRSELEQRGYILALKYFQELPPPAGEETCKNSSEQTEL